MCPRDDQRGVSLNVAPARLGGGEDAANPVGEGVGPEFRQGQQPLLRQLGVGVVAHLLGRQLPEDAVGAEGRWKGVSLVLSGD